MWQLIDAAGCRGLRIGGAMVSQQHCNFLINDDDASAKPSAAKSSLFAGKGPTLDAIGGGSGSSGGGGGVEAPPPESPRRLGKQPMAAAERAAPAAPRAGCG